MPDLIPLKINGSNGFTLCGVAQSAFTTRNNGESKYLCYAANCSYGVFNDTAQLPMQVTIGNGTSYNGDKVYSHPNLVGYWDWDGSLVDRTKWGDNATLNAGALQLNNSANCKSGGCLGLTGTDDYASAQWAPFPYGASSRTVYCWDKQTDLSGTQIIWSYGAASSNQVYGVYTGSNYNLWGYGGGTADWDTGIGGFAGGWNIIMQWYDGNERHFFINATDRGSQVHAYNTQGGSFIFGAGTGNLGLDITGYIDDCAIYNTTLTGGTITAIYDNYQNIQGYGNLGASESACIPSYSCASYGACNTSNILPCINVTDPVCNTTYTGLLSTYDGACSYDYPPSWVQYPPNLTAVKGVPQNIELNATDDHGTPFIRLNDSTRGISVNASGYLRMNYTDFGIFFYRVNATDNASQTTQAYFRVNVSCVPYWYCSSRVCGVDNVSNCTAITDYFACNTTSPGNESAYNTACVYGSNSAGSIFNLNTGGLPAATLFVGLIILWLGSGFLAIYSGGQFEYRMAFLLVGLFLAIDAWSIYWGFGTVLLLVTVVGAVLAYMDK